MADDGDDGVIGGNLGGRGLAAFGGAAGIFGLEALGGLGGVSLTSQLIGTALGVLVALVGGLVIYGGLKALVGIKLDQEEEYNGADLTIHKIYSTPDYKPE